MRGALDGVEGDGGVGDREAGGEGGGVEYETPVWMRSWVSYTCANSGIRRERRRGGKGQRKHALRSHPNIHASYLKLLVLVLVFCRIVAVDSYCCRTIGTPVCAIGQSRECWGGRKV